MGLKGFFKAIGRGLKRTFQIVAKYVPDDLLVAAIGYAQAQANQQIENSLKRQAVIQALMRIHGVSESTARLVTELAVKHIKEQVVDKAAAKAVTEATKP